MLKKFKISMILALFCVGIMAGILPIHSKADTQPVALPLLEIQTGFIDDSNPEDWYVFQLDNECMNLNLLLYDMTDDLELYLYYWNATSSELVLLKSSKGVSNESIIIQILGPLDLYIKVERYGSAVSGYKLSSQISLITKIYDVFQTYSGIVEPYGVNYYYFTIPAKRIPLLLRVSEFSGNLDVWVKNRFGTVHTGSFKSGAGVSEEILFPSHYYDNYTIIIEIKSESPIIDSFSLILMGPWMDQEPNNLSSQANYLNIDEGGYGEISTIDDQDFYKISVFPGQKYIFSLEEITANLKMTLYKNDSSTVIAQNTVSGVRSKYITYVAETNEYLHLLIEGNNTTPRYHLVAEIIVMNSLLTWGIQANKTYNYSLTELGITADYSFKINSLEWSISNDFALVDVFENGTLTESKPMFRSSTNWKPGTGYECYFKSPSLDRHGFFGLIAVPLMANQVNMTWMKRSAEEALNPDSSIINGNKLTLMFPTTKFEFEWSANGILRKLNVTEGETQLLLLVCKDTIDESIDNPLLPTPSPDVEPVPDNTFNINGYNPYLLLGFMVGAVSVLMKKRKKICSNHI